MKEKFVEPFIDDAKVEILTDEELDTITGGAAAVYYSQPYLNKSGKEVIQVVTVNDTSSYDSNTGKFSSYRSFMSIPSNRINEYIDRQKSRGYDVIGINAAGPLV